MLRVNAFVSAIVFEQTHYDVPEDSIFSLLCLDISGLQVEKTILLSTVPASARGSYSIVVYNLNGLEWTTYRW